MKGIGLAGTALSAPTLAQEAAASGRATAALIKALGLKKGLKESSKLIIPFLTYLGIGAMPAAAGFAGAAVHDRMKKKQEGK